MRLLYAAAIDNAISPGGLILLRLGLRGDAFGGTKSISRDTRVFKCAEKGNTVERHTQM